MTAAATPRVSIYMPTHNRAQLLLDAVASVQAQTLQDWELIIADDGSHDDTPQVLERLAATDSRIRTLRLDPAGGACAARNRAIEAARGHYVTGLDDDDRFAPDRLASLLEAITPEDSLVASLYWFFDGHEERPGWGAPERVAMEDLRWRNLLGNQVLVERKRVLAVGGFDESLAGWQDYDLWLRLVERFGPARVQQRRSYGVNVSGDHVRITTSERAERGYRQFMDKHGGSLSDAQRHAHRVNDYYNRKVRLGLGDTLRLSKDLRSADRLSRLYLLTHFPRLGDWLGKTLAGGKPGA